MKWTVRTFRYSESNCIYSVVIFGHLPEACTTIRLFVNLWPFTASCILLDPTRSKKRIKLKVYGTLQNGNSLLSNNPIICWLTVSQFAS